MKKLLIIALILSAILLSFAACGDNDIAPDNKTDVLPDDNHGNIVACEHEFGEWKTEIEPTCQSKGLLVRECSVCNEQESTYISELTNHTIVVDNAISPTCQNTGLTEGTHCSVCGVVIVAQEPVAEIAHIESDWIVVTEADYGVEGYKYIECTMCFEKLHEEIIPALQNADFGAISQMNIALADLKADATIDDVIVALIANGYAGDLTTENAAYSLAWLPSARAIVAIEDGAVVYPKAYAGATGYVILNRLATDADSLIAGLAAGKVHMNGNVTVDGKLAPEATGIYEVVLNGYTVYVNDYVGSWIEGCKLVISHGTIDGSTTTNTTVIYVSDGGEVELNNVQIYAPEGTNPLQCYGGTMVLNNVTVAQIGNNAADYYNSAIQVVNKIKQVDGKYTICGEQAHTTINGGMYTGDKAIQISAPGGNVTINGGTLTGTTYVINSDFAPKNYPVEDPSITYESVITINGGTLNGNIKISAATELVINGGTFTGDTLQVGNAKVALTAEALAPYVTAGSTIVVNGVSFTK